MQNAGKKMCQHILYELKNKPYFIGPVCHGMWLPRLSTWMIHLQLAYVYLRISLLESLPEIHILSQL